LILVLIFLFAIGFFVVQIMGSDDMKTTSPPPAAAIASGNGGLPPSQLQASPAAPLATLAPPTPTPDVLATLAAAEARLTPVAGPQATALTLAEPRRPVALDAGVVLADVAAAATFVNPTTAPWDYGFAFRHDLASHFRFVVGADGSWYLIHVTETPAVVENYVANGQLINLRLGPGERNHIRLIALADAAYFFINSEYEGMASLSNKRESGRVFAATGTHPSMLGTWSVVVEEFTVSTQGN
jgi:hypothetical protein